MQLDDVKIGMKVRAISSVIKGAKGVVRRLDVNPRDSYGQGMWVEFDFGDDPDNNMVLMYPAEVKPCE
jgi:hypothetical protein